MKAESDVFIDVHFENRKAKISRFGTYDKHKSAFHLETVYYWKPCGEGEVGAVICGFVCNLLCFSPKLILPAIDQSNYGQRIVRKSHTIHPYIGKTPCW